MDSNELKAFNEACEMMLSALVADSTSASPAYVFRAYIAWRIAEHSKAVAIASIEGQAREPADGYPGNASIIKATMDAKLLHLKRMEHALFNRLDSIAWEAHSAGPSVCARTAVARRNVGTLMGEAMRLALDNPEPPTDEQLRERIAQALDLSPTNVRKLHVDFLGDAGLTNDYSKIQAKFQEQRTKHRQRRAKVPSKSGTGRKKPLSWER